jgi:5-methylcytosine-specific restriction endonuclease McrA
MLQSHRSDNLIVLKLKHSLGVEACSVAAFLVLLQELDGSRGWARLGYASLFDFCHAGLNLTRAESYSRTRLARLAGEVPQVISLLKSEVVSLSALRILAPVLTAENFDDVLATIRGKSTREVEDFRNAFRPVDKHAARGCVRTIFSVDRAVDSAVLGGAVLGGALPGGAPIAVPPVAEPVAATVETRAVIKAEAADVSRPVTIIAAPLDAMPEAVKVAAPSCHVQKSVRMSLTLNNKVWDKYQRACDISNHSSAGGDVAAMMEMLLDDYLKHHDVAAKQKPHKQDTQECVRDRSVRARSVRVEAVRVEAVKSVDRSENVTNAQVKHSRYIPKSIRRKVRERDAEQCSYVDAATGRRCECKRGLQYDHIKPFALGGVSSSPQNLRLLCAAHNRLAAENIFGFEFMASKIRSGGQNLES